MNLALASSDIASGAPPSDSARLMLSRASSALAADDLQTALTLSEQACRIVPGWAAARHVLGLVALRLGQLPTAIDFFEQAHLADPATRDHAEALGIAYAAVGRLTDSLYYGKLATALSPSIEFSDLLPPWIGNFTDHFGAIREAPLLSRASQALTSGRFQIAASLFLQQIALDQESVAAWRGLGAASLARGQTQDAIMALRAACTLAPENPSDHAALGRAYTHAARHGEGVASHARAVDLSDSFEFKAGLAAAIAEDPEVTREAVAGFLRGLSPSGPAPRAPSGTNRPDPRQRLRVGLVSANFRAGGGLDTLLPLIEQRDRSRWDAILYMHGSRDDAVARRFRNAASLTTEIGDLDDETAAMLIGNDAVDILIDLDLFASGWRGGIAAQRPAPCVLSWLGIAECAAALGYDGVIDGNPDAGNETPHDAAPAISVAGGLVTLPADRAVSRRAMSSGAPVFTTLAPYRRISAEMIACWRDILDRIPGCMFVLDPATLGGDESAGMLGNRLGMADRPDRILIREAGADAPPLLSLCDVVLDVPGHGRAETALDCVAAGVPMLCLPGILPLQGAAAALMRVLGMTPLVAESRSAYLGAALSLAAPDARADIAAHLDAALEHNAELLSAKSRARAFAESLAVAARLPRARA